MKKTILLLTLLLTVFSGGISAWGDEISIIDNSDYYSAADSSGAYYICDADGNRLCGDAFTGIEYMGGHFVVYYFDGRYNNAANILNESFEPVLEFKYSNIEYNYNTGCYECYYSSGYYTKVDFYGADFEKLSQPVDIMPVDGTNFYRLTVINEDNAVQKYYYICDADGNKVINDAYSSIISYSGNIIAADFSGKKGIYDSSLNLAENIEYDWIYYDEDGHFFELGKFEYDDLGEIIENITYLNDDLQVTKPIAKLAGTDYYTIEDTGGVFYICDEKGTCLSESKYLGIEGIGGGFIAVRSSDKYPLKYGVLDNDLNKVADEDYEKIVYEPNNNVLKCITSGKTVIYDENFAAAEEDNNIVFVTPIDGMDGRYIYDSAPDDVMLNSNKLIFDSSGNALTKKYASISDKVQAGNMLIVTEPMGHSDLMYGVLNSDLQIVVSPQLGAVSIEEENGIVYAVRQFGEEVTFYDIYGNVYADRNELLDVCKNNGEASSWAAECINAAVKAGIVPDDIQSAYTKKITRREFCCLAVMAYAAKTGAEITENAESPFDDVNDDYVTMAYKLGIAAGVGDRAFAPDNNITRQEAAVMLSNLADVLEISKGKNDMKFVDESYIADWAKTAVYNVSGIKSGDTYVMAGTGNGKFSPWMNYTREQAIATVYRLYDV